MPRVLRIPAKEKRQEEAEVGNIEAMSGELQGGEIRPILVRDGIGHLVGGRRQGADVGSGGDVREATVGLNLQGPDRRDIPVWQGLVAGRGRVRACVQGGAAGGPPRDDQGARGSAGGRPGRRSGRDGGAR